MTIMTSMLPEEFKKMIQAAVESSVRRIVEEQRMAKFQLVTIDELRKILNVSRTTIDTWKKKGIIPSLNVGGRVLFNLDEVMAAINNQNKGTGNRKTKKSKAA